MRTILERISRGVYYKRKIKVNNNFYPIYVSPDAQLKYLKIGTNAFDVDLIKLAEKLLQEDSIVWDIGANVGVFTFAAASVAKKGVVLSIEADIWLAQLLIKTAKLPEYEGIDIRILPVAVSCKDTVSRFMIANRGRASNSLESAGGRSQMGGNREIQYVPTLSIDTILKEIPKPDFVKIDVEGAELMLLQGAKFLIESVRPTFYIEIGKEHQKDIYNMFVENNYNVYSTNGNRLNNHCEFNTFFLPNEKTNTNKTFSTCSLKLID